MTIYFKELDGRRIKKELKADTVRKGYHYKSPTVGLFNIIIYLDRLRNRALELRGEYFRETGAIFKLKIRYSSKIPRDPNKFPFAGDDTKILINKLNYDGWSFVHLMDFLNFIKETVEK